MFIVPVGRPVHRDARQFIASAATARLLGDTLDHFFTPAAAAAATAAEAPARSPALDVAESDHAYTVTLEVPGVAKEDLQVSVEGRRVTVQTGLQPRKTVEPKPADAPAADGAQAGQAPAPTPQASDRIVYRERAAVRYARSFTLPADVEQAEAGAKLEHGVLTLTLPKRNARAAAQLTIN